MARLTTGQIRQLIEIDAAGTGIRFHVQELIQRLTSGGVAGSRFDGLRRVQAKALWDKGWGRELKIRTFESYLDTIPGVPFHYGENDARFPDLILVDPRLPLTVACRLAGLEFEGDDSTLVDYDPRRSRFSPYWLLCQDGRRNSGKSIWECRESFPEDEWGLTAIEGVCYYVHKPNIIGGHSMDLLGSIHPEGPNGAASLGYWDDVPVLHWHRYGNSGSGYGAASRRVLPLITYQLPTAP